jgi:hypothetical protein
MTLELWNTLASLGTFVVIAATAIAALVQLRHARGSNQIAAITELENAAHTPQFVAAEHWVMTELANKLEDAEFRYQVENRSARTPENRALISRAATVGDHYENMGVLVKRGLIDRDIALDIWSGSAPDHWNRLAPFTAIMRQVAGPATLENFEYFVVLCQDWLAAHPEGDYPAGVRRIDLKNKWLEADKQYAASREIA